MARAIASDPFQSFNFWVQLLGAGITQIDAGFVTVSTPEMTIEGVEYKSGVMKQKQKYPGQKTFNDITLTRGLLKNQTDFYSIAMLSQTQQGAYRFDCDIIQNHRDGSQRIYHLLNCQVTRCKVAGDLDANASDIAVEEMDIQYEDFTIEHKDGASTVNNALKVAP
jgi:phage tail-like protein